MAGQATAGGSLNQSKSDAVTLWAFRNRVIT
jgi:hypothetical protein